MVAEGGPRRVAADLSAFYFFSFGGLGGILPFLPLLLVARGLTPSQVGWVMIVGPVANLLAPPAWGWLADAFRARLTLLRLTGVGCAAGAMAFVLDAGFAGSLAAMALYSVFRAPVAPLADAAAHAELGADAHRFARIRIWGSLGFAVFAFTIGQLEGSMNPGTMLGLTAGAYLMSTASTARLKAPPRIRQPSVWGPAFAFILEPRMLALFVGSALYYVAHGSYDVYFGLHAKALGHGDDFVGLAWMVAVAFEIALMVIAPRLLAGRSGEWFLVVAAVASVARWTMLSMFEAQAPILFAQALHALTFGLWYLALVRYIQVRAPDEVRTTVQALSQAAHALGMIAGYLVGGRLFELGGGSLVFRMAAGCALAAGVLYTGLALDARRVRP